jgi:aspartate aminotransferase
MTGWRLGYMAGPADLVQACDKIQAQFTSGANSITQKASVEALLGDLSATKKMVDSFRQRKEYVIGALSKIPGVKISEPGGAFYAFPDVSGFYGKSANGYQVQNDDDMAMYLLNVAHVATVCGTAFGTSKCIRISFAASMTSLTDAMARITKALTDLQ